MPSALDRANAAFDCRSWSAAVTAYADADRERPLPAAALERWGLAAFLTGRDEESDSARERAHHAYLADDDIDGAARVGHWLGITLRLRGEHGRANGWFARVRTMLDERGIVDSVWHVCLRMSTGMDTLFGGDPAAAAEMFEQLIVDSERFEHPDVYVLVRNGLGQSLVATGRIDEGLRRLDEVMVAVTTNDQVSPQAVGLMYCAVIETCRRCFDLARAREWTDVLSRWCASQPDLVPYRGQCLVHRAEVLALHGSWPDASAEVEQVFARLGEDLTDMAAGMAHYQRGELHRLRGEYDKAEESYRKASRCGHDPQPGLSQMRATNDRVDAAYAALRRAIDEVRGAQDRLRLLPAYVDISLAAGDLPSATAAAEELRTAATERNVALLTAAAALAEGQIALAGDDAAAALPLLRQALTTWQRIGAPYDAAMTRVHIATACRSLGDHDTADLELDAARWAFEQLGAAPDVARVQAMSGRPAAPAPPGGLTPREAQILRLVATGATNRAIATQLFLSEKTVARHVANIFLKLDVSSRSAATAFAYEHHLL